MGFSGWADGLQIPSQQQSLDVVGNFTEIHANRHTNEI